VKPIEFDPKAGILELSFTDGSFYSLALAKKYHSEEAFYADLFWDETDAGQTLSLALHPKSENLAINSCKIKWSLPQGMAKEVTAQGFTQHIPSGWHKPPIRSTPPSFLKKLAKKKLNAYDPMPNAWEVKASYQSIGIRNGQQVIEIKSTDESAALTVFSLLQNGGVLVAENQSTGYHLRHTFPAFELQFETKKQRHNISGNTPSKVFALAISPPWVEQGMLDKLVRTCLIEEENFKSIVLKEHHNIYPLQDRFDESLFSAFAKTCIAANVLPGIVLSPFVVPSEVTNTGLKVDQDARFKRWSTSLQRWVYPIDISDEDTHRASEQHLMQFYQKGFRYFIVEDVAMSLRDGIGSTTTGQQLHQRLDMLRRTLPGASIILGDLSCTKAYDGFCGFQPKNPSRDKLRWLAKFAGLGTPSPSFGKHAPFRIPTTSYTPGLIGKAPETHGIIDLSEKNFDKKTLLALESTLGSVHYPS